MNYNASATHSKNKQPRLSGLIVACSFTLLVLAGSLALSSCASTPAGLAREEKAYNATSNTVAFLQPIAAASPAPFNTLLEGVLAAGGALLAFWASHLHRSVAELKNGNGSPPAKTPQPPPAQAA